MVKGAAVVTNTLGITKGIDLMEQAGKATGGMMKVLIGLEKFLSSCVFLSVVTR